MKVDLSQLDFVGKKVKSIALDIERQFGVEFKVTSIYRENDRGVHGTLPCRGLDLSCPDRHFGKLIETYVNQKFEYDNDRPEKKCCMYHDVGSGWHIHLQSHPNTQVR